MDKSEAKQLLKIKSDWQQIGSSLERDDGFVAAGSGPGATLTVVPEAIDPISLKAGALVLLCNEGTAGQLAKHQVMLLKRLADLGHSVASLEFVPASDLERLLARELVDVAARV